MEDAEVLAAIRAAADDGAKLDVWLDSCPVPALRPTIRRITMAAFYNRQIRGLISQRDK